MRTTIPWGDGTGDNIYLDYSAAAGDQSVSVSSDANGGSSARSKQVSFSASGVSPVILTISQDAGGSILPAGAIPCELIYTDGLLTFINTSLVPSASMSFEVDVCWVKADSTLECLFGYMINSMRFAPLLRETKLQVQYNYWYNTNWQMPSGIKKYHHKVSVTPTGATIQTYTPDGLTLLDTQSVSYSQSVTFVETIGLFGRKNSSSTIANGSGRSGLGRIKCYSDANFTTLVADFNPCYYNGNFGFWDNVAKQMLIGNTPANVFGFGEHWNTQGFYPNTYNDKQANRREDRLVDYRGYATSAKYAVPSGCTQIRFNAGTIETNQYADLMFFDSNDNYVDWFSYFEADRVINVPTTAATARLTMPVDKINDCYIYDMTHSQYIWRGINVNI